MKKYVPKLYENYFVKKNDERDELFGLIKEKYNPSKGLYPGSFVHITPSFFIEEMTYVDNDRRITSFFNDPALADFVESKKQYSTKSKIISIQLDFREQLPIKDEHFDLLISLYSGFISQHCKKYLKTNGLLIANNSHGDSSIAFTDNDYILISVIARNGNRFRLITNNLDSYFQKKDGAPIDREKVFKKMSGEGFIKTGYAYVFKKIK